MTPRPNDPVYPLSFSQESLWFLHQLDPAMPAYNTVFLYRLTGLLDLTALEQSLEVILRRHASLRSIFPAENGVPRQMVLPFEARPLPVLDYAKAPEGERLDAAFRFAVEENKKPIDVAVGPIFQPSLLTFTERDHILAIHVHHLVSDAWSEAVIARELAEAYAAISRRATPSLPDLKMQFGDYVLWQREWMQGERLDEYLDYWKRKLEGPLPVLDLYTDRPRQRLQTFEGMKISHSLPPQLAADLKSFSRRERVTLFMTLLAAFKSLLSRYTGQEDLIVGSPFANRFPEETENLIGYFVNTLPLRTDLSGDPSFRELLGRVRTTVLEAIKYQALPFEYIVEQLNPARELNRTPVFQVVMNMVNVPQFSSSAGDLQIQLQEYDRRITSFDLMIQVHERGGEIHVYLAGNTDLFDGETLERMYGHFVRLLQGALEAPETKLSALPLLTEAERAQLAAWNETFRPYPSEAGIQRLFEARVREAPEQPALLADGVRLSYGELNRQANRLAHALQSLGLKPAEPVALCVERAPEAAIGALAILKAGGVYLPVDPSYPRERIAFMLEDSRARFLLTQTALLAGLEDLPARAVCIDDPAAFATQAEEDPASSCGGTDPACIFYTSGSTGQPKGILVPHRAVARLVVNTDYIQIRPADIVGQVSNLAFDAFTFELWGALLNGATLAFIPYLVSLSPHQFASRLSRDGVTVAFMTATLFNLMVQNTPNAFTGLRCLLVGGEQLDPEFVRELLRGGGPERLLNAYGPTETATFACTYWIESVPESATLIPIGKPIANTTAHVVDRNLNLVPVGVPGELLIGGEAVTLGYLNRPELTAEKFLRDPFSSDPAARLYRTGDRVRRRPDGSLEFLGRFDDQIKIRGFRVEPGEVEVALKAHPAVREAAVVAQKGPQGKQLAAFYIPSGMEHSASALRDYLKAKLPDYMVPAAHPGQGGFPPHPGRQDRPPGAGSNGDKRQCIRLRCAAGPGRGAPGRYLAARARPGARRHDGRFLRPGRAFPARNPSLRRDREGVCLRPAAGGPLRTWHGRRDRRPDQIRSGGARLAAADPDAERGKRVPGFPGSGRRRRGDVSA